MKFHIAYPEGFPAQEANLSALYAAGHVRLSTDWRGMTRLRFAPPFADLEFVAGEPAPALDTYRRLQLALRFFGAVPRFRARSNG